MIVAIPVKKLETAKSRLAGALDRAAREALVLRLLDRSIAAARSVGKPVLITSDPTIAEFAEGRRCALLRQDQDRGLDKAAANGRAAWVDEELVILAADLPEIAAAALARFVAAGRRHGAAIAPCRREDGTNAFYLPPGVNPRFAYGPESFRRHCSALAAIGRKAHVHRSAALGFDLDIPADLAAMS